MSQEEARFRTTITPMMSFMDASVAIEFYKRAFGAVEVECMRDGDDRIMHAEIKIGDASLMLSDEYPSQDALCVETVGGTPILLLLQVEDVDSFVAHAIAEGATLTREVAGDALRNGKLVDPFGYRWMILTRNEP